MELENRRGDWAGNISIQVVSIWMEFKARSLMTRRSKVVGVSVWGASTFRGEGMRSQSRSSYGGRRTKRRDSWQPGVLKEGRRGHLDQMPLMDGHKEDGELTECGDAKAIADLDKSSLGRRWDQKPG